MAPKPPPGALPAPDLSDDYARLEKAVRKQQKQLQYLNQQREKDQAAMRRLEQKLLTNFQLMERSVSDTLADVTQKVDQLERSLQQNRVQSSTPVAPTRLSNKRMPETKRTNASPPPVIENYSLFSAKKSPPPRISRQNASVAKTPVNPPQPVPVPIPESGLNSGNYATPPPSGGTPVPVPTIIPPPNDSEQTFMDPDLEDPANPFILQPHPPVKKLYDQGMDAMINRRYSDATKTFENMLKQFPNDEYSDNAQFWVGHIYFSLNQLGPAEAAFRKVLRHYEHRPTSQGYKTPDAVYMLGKIAESRNDPARAQYYFKEVIKRFPGSTAAGNAEEDLKIWGGATE